MTGMAAKAAERWRRGLDPAFKALTFLCASMVGVIILAILLVLVKHSLPSLREFGLGFLVDKSWNPVTQKFGALSTIFGTLLTTAIALALAVPMGTVIALFLVEMAPPWLARWVGGAIELLAAIPSIIYGMWGLFVFAPFMARHVQPFIKTMGGGLPLFAGPPMGLGMLTAGIILALMILPFIASVTRDVFSMVPPVIKESAYGMGSTTYEVTRHVTVRYGIKGVVGAALLGLGRAIGETMAVTFVIGNDHRISASLFAAGNTIASSLANEFAEATDALYLSSLFELGLVLFLITFIIQALGQLLVSRMRRRMGAGL
jgi:phosphate transport system permease protein